MKFHRQIASAFLMMSIFAPAVFADIPVYPNEFNKLKNLTGRDRQNRNNGGYIAPEPNKENSKPDTKNNGGGKNEGTDGKLKIKADDKNSKSNVRTSDVKAPDTKAADAKTSESSARK